MTPQGRVAAAITVLDLVLAGEAAEKALIGWARGARYAGSGDRAAVRDHVFDALRAKRSMAALGGAMTGRGLMIGLLRRAGIDPSDLFNGHGHGPPPLLAVETPQKMPLTPAESGDLPDWLYPPFAEALGADCDPVLATMQTRAPLFLRVNLSRIDRSDAQAALAADGIGARPHPDVSTALEVIENSRKVSSSTAYLTGQVEVQDASSQAAVLALPLAPEHRVLDYCAGGGGKALALADRARLDIIAHDSAPRRMADLEIRAARAGVRIGILNGDPATAGLFDLVVCDAPCSGSGTWRRSPDAKWRLTPAALADLTRLQATILDLAADRVDAAGTLAYMTCSVLDAENSAQVAGFLARRPGWRLVNTSRWLPGPGGDGFFLAVLQPGRGQP